MVDFLLNFVVRLVDVAPPPLDLHHVFVRVQLLEVQPRDVRRLVPAARLLRRVLFIYCHRPPPLLAVGADLHFLFLDILLLRLQTRVVRVFPATINFLYVLCILFAMQLGFSGRLRLLLLLFVFSPDFSFLQSGLFEMLQIPKVNLDDAGC